MGQFFSSCIPLFFPLLPLPPTTIDDLPEECFVHVFRFLHSVADRNNCSLVCRRWLVIDSRSRYRLSLKVHSDQITSFPLIFRRFPNISQISLKFPQEYSTIPDQALVHVSLGCPNLSSLTIEVSRNFSLVTFGSQSNESLLMSFSRCSVSVDRITDLLSGCSTLESLSIKGPIILNSSENLSGANGNTSSHLKSIHLEGIANASALLPLIAASKTLKSLALIQCSSDWNKAMEIISEGAPELVSLHLERLKFSDRGLSPVTRFQELQVLRLVKTNMCSESAFFQLTAKCTGLKKVWIDGLSSGDDESSNHSLIGLGMNCGVLEKLVVGGMQVSRRDLWVLGNGCLELESLSVREMETFGDEELRVIGTNFRRLKEISVKGCRVSDVGIMALCDGSRKLVKVKVKNCKRVSRKGMEMFVDRRGGVVEERLSKKHFQKMCVWSI